MKPYSVPETQNIVTCAFRTKLTACINGLPRATILDNLMRPTCSLKSSPCERF